MSKPNLCVWNGCAKVSIRKTVPGLCDMHYNRKRRGHDMDAPIRVLANETGICVVDGCGKPVKGKARLCKMHEGRLRYGRKMESPPKYERLALGEEGPRRYTKDGYIRFSIGGRGCVREHVHVMEQKVGRRLLPHEQVHHMNGVRDDNRIENLELWTTSHPPGQRVADKVKWAKELLELYAPEALA